MATKPELRRAVANGYIKASDYNYNFDQLNNYIENGVADNAINNYEADREYSKGQWVLANTSEGKGLYESQVDGNKGNSLLDTTYWKKLVLGGASNLFDTVLKDHILTYEETKGLALQGTYVYKEALTGSRYGYPDFYAKCLEEKESATTTEVTIGSSTITMYINSNGHQFYDIADKEAVDAWFETYGYAWFYGVDAENERIFLPRQNLLNITDKSILPVAGNGKSLGLTNGTANVGLINVSGAGFRETVFNVPVGTAYSGTAGNTIAGALGVTTDPTKSGIESRLTGFKEENKYLYICVGNTTNYTGMTDVVNQGMEILEQVAQKVNVDGTNLNAEGKSLISGYSMPSSKYIDLTLGASLSTYTAPANGWVILTKVATANSQHVGLGVLKQGETIPSSLTLLYVKNVWLFNGNIGSVMIPVLKGYTFYPDYSALGETVRFRFIYAEGEQ